MRDFSLFPPPPERCLVRVPDSVSMLRGQNVRLWTVPKHRLAQTESTSQPRYDGAVPSLREPFSPGCSQLLHFEAARTFFLPPRASDGRTRTCWNPLSYKRRVNVINAITGLATKIPPRWGFVEDRNVAFSIRGKRSDWLRLMSL